MMSARNLLRPTQSDQNSLRCGQTAYDLAADSYNRRYASDLRNDLPIIQRVMDDLQPSAHTRPSVLDVGCGVGTNLRMFSDLGFKATGIDISQTMLRYARIHAPECELFHADIRDYTTSQGEFDLVFAKAFIHLFPYTESFKIGQILASKLKKGGLLYVTTTIHEIHTEGLEPKEDYPGQPLRFRSRWTNENWTPWLYSLDLKILRQWINTDPRSKKTWINATLRTTDA